MPTHAFKCAILSCFKVLEVTLMHMPPKCTKKPKITVFLTGKKTLKMIFSLDTFHLAMFKYHRINTAYRQQKGHTLISN